MRLYTYTWTWIWIWIWNLESRARGFIPPVIRWLIQGLIQGLKRWVAAGHTVLCVPQSSFFVANHASREYEAVVPHRVNSVCGQLRETVTHLVRRCPNLATYFPEIIDHKVSVWRCVMHQAQNFYPEPLRCQ